MLTGLQECRARAIAPGQAKACDDLCELVADKRSEQHQQLLQEGVLLFRGWHVQSTADLIRFIHSFEPGSKLFDYAGGASPRRPLGDGSYSSTEYPPNLPLSLHNELSYASIYPSRIYFLCLQEAHHGGETTIGDSRQILARIDGNVLERFRHKGVLYIRNLSPDSGSGYSWQDAFETADPQQAEVYCRRMGADFQWLDGGFLQVRQERPATAVHPETGHEVWFNQADGFHPSALDPKCYEELLLLRGCEDRFRLNSAYGDGCPIESETLAHVRQIIRSETIAHKWRRGDLLVLDNLLTAHGRMPFAGDRKIALAMT